MADEDLLFDDAWMAYAACRGLPHRIFFPDVHDDDRWPKRKPEYDEARAICATCPVQIECLESELAYGAANQHGMRAGLEPFERRGIIRRRKYGR